MPRNYLELIVQGLILTVLIIGFITGIRLVIKVVATILGVI